MHKRYKNKIHFCNLNLIKIKNIKIMIKPNKYVNDTAKALIGLFSNTEEMKMIGKDFLDT